MSIPFDEGQPGVQQQMQYHIQNKEAYLRQICKVVVWAGFAVLFLILETLWFTLPLSSETKAALIWLTVIAIPLLGVLTWYCLQLSIGFKVSSMHIEALRDATQPMPPVVSPSSFSSSPTEVRIEKVNQEEESIIPATFSTLDEVGSEEWRKYGAQQHQPYYPLQ